MTISSVFHGIMKIFRDINHLGKNSAKLLSKNEPLVLGSSTAFFTTFSLAPILILLINTFSLITEEYVIRDEIYESIKEALGEEIAETVHILQENIVDLGTDWYITIFGIIFLIFIATTLIKIVQVSINQIWGFKNKTKKHLLRALIDRAIALVIIMLIGLLVLVSIIAQTTLNLVSDFILQFIPWFDLPLIQLLNELVAFLFVFVFFLITFKLLPSAIIKWSSVWVGALITTVLFAIGRAALVRLLPATNIFTIYGASGSIVLILLFVFYSSMIIYLGAAFTKVYAEFRGDIIKPKPYAIRFKIVEIDGSSKKK